MSFKSRAWLKVLSLTFGIFIFKSIQPISLTQMIQTCFVEANTYKWHASAKQLILTPLIYHSMTILCPHRTSLFVVLLDDFKLCNICQRKLQNHFEYNKFNAIHTSRKQTNNPKHWFIITKYVHIDSKCKFFLWTSISSWCVVVSVFVFVDDELICNTNFSSGWRNRTFRSRDRLSYFGFYFVFFFQFSLYVLFIDAL